MSCCERGRLGITNSFQLTGATRASRWRVPAASKAARPATAASAGVHPSEGRTEGRKGEAANPRATAEFTLLFLRRERFSQRPGRLLGKEDKKHLTTSARHSNHILRDFEKYWTVSGKFCHCISPSSPVTSRLCTALD